MVTKIFMANHHQPSLTRKAHFHYKCRMEHLFVLLIVLLLSVLKCNMSKKIKETKNTLFHACSGNEPTTISLLALTQIGCGNCQWQISGSKCSHPVYIFIYVQSRNVSPAGTLLHNTWLEQVYLYLFKHYTSLLTTTTVCLIISNHQVLTRKLKI